MATAGRSGDTRYLEQHGQQWRVVVFVPRHLRPILGKAALRRGLGTDSLAKAQVKRWPVVTEFKQIIAAAEAKAKAGPASDPLTAEALGWRESLDILDTIAKATDLPSDAEHAHFARSVIADRIIPEIEREHGPAKAREYAGIVEGRRTPLALHHEPFLAEHKHLAKRTIGDHRRALKRLAEYATGSGFACTIEAFSDRRTAGLFVSHLIAQGAHPKTANKLLTMLAGYWRWLIRRGLAPGHDQKRDNPWLGQSLPTAAARHKLPSDARDSDHSNEAGEYEDDDDDGKREFTDEELGKLLNTPTVESTAEPLLSDLMYIAALSGMRIGEITRLRVRDIDPEAGTFRIRRAKTEAGNRIVPIHPDLGPIIARLVQDTPKGSTLFASAAAASGEAEPYDLLGKRFARHRKRLGIHEQPEGQRQSNVDFHSFRRWFTTKAEQAGIPPHIISKVVGHKKGREGMTLGVYSGGPSLDQLRQCVEAVKLPQPQSIATTAAATTSAGAADTGNTGTLAPQLTGAAGPSSPDSRLPICNQRPVTADP